MCAHTSAPTTYACASCARWHLITVRVSAAPLLSLNWVSAATLSPVPAPHDRLAHKLQAL